jgi:hypothetical protein
MGRLSLFLLAAWLPFPAGFLVDSSSPSCHLAVKPTQLTTHDTVTVTYLLTGLPFQPSAGSVRFQEEVLGRLTFPNPLLRLVDSAG